MASNDNNSPQNIVLMDGYFNVTCQLNDNTKWLGQNQRLILGSKAYHITGYTDFIQEFTGDYESIHILKFTIRVEEPTIDDDLINHIANGYNYTFGAKVSGVPSLSVGQTTQLKAEFIKNGVAVPATEEYPLTWEWRSSDESIATVDANGNVTAKTAGNVRIYIDLQECSGTMAYLDLSIEEADTSSNVAFIGNVQPSLTQYRTAVLQAGYYENGVLSGETVEWSFNGAQESAYHAVVDGNQVSITCLLPDSTPLHITASYGEYSAEADIVLEGY